MKRPESTVQAAIEDLEDQYGKIVIFLFLKLLSV